MNSVDWNGRMECWSGVLERSTGLDYWRGCGDPFVRMRNVAVSHVSAFTVESLVGQTG